ncbi:phytoene/squalene synthase family protein [Streptomyces sp. NPDC057757]|uniref:phytoene/squalene synthase family protein n=1 Tax=Streptomyces sp. NPDC057757 TaxID=3346241 RepID=UPI0036903CA0
MTKWSAALDQAGVDDAHLRRDYDTRRRLVRRFAREEYVATRLLLPARLHPAVIAAVAFMHETDERIDAGDPLTRQEALRSWNRDVTAALEGDHVSPQPTLRALADVARRHPQLRARVRTFLDGAPTEANWNGFDTEADFQDYIDDYSLPALMLTAALIAPPSKAGQDEAFQRGCRSLIEAWQRTDFLADLPEDIEQGRIGIPDDELSRHGLKLDDLRGGPVSRTEAARLVSSQVALAEAAFARCRSLPALVDAENRPFLRALISVQELRLHDVRRRGGTILRTGARPSVPATLRVLAREYRAARNHQRRPQ